MSDESDPRTNDLWLTPLMGPAHFYPKGSPTALCGFPWQSMFWDGGKKQPQNVCPECVAAKSGVDPELACMLENDSIGGC